MAWKRTVRRVGMMAAAVIVLSAPRVFATTAAPPPALPGAPEAVLYDPASGQFLYQRAAHRRVAVASLEKLMTARLLIESGQLGGTAMVPAGVVQLPETKVGLVPGQQLSMQVLLDALLVRSANDAALTIAVALAGSESALATQMNAEARHLGLTDTNYVDSSGLDAPGQYSSAADTAILAADDMQLPAFSAAVRLSQVRMPGGAVYGTVNPFLAYYPGADGIKTGFTTDAGFCLAASAVHDGRTLIAVVLGAPNWAVVDADAAALLNWGFANTPAPPAGGGAAAGGSAAVSSTGASGPTAGGSGTGTAAAGAGGGSATPSSTESAAPGAGGGSASGPGSQGSGGVGSGSSSTPAAGSGAASGNGPRVGTNALGGRPAASRTAGPARRHSVTAAVLAALAVVAAARLAVRRRS